MVTAQRKKILAFIFVLIVIVPVVLGMVYEVNLERNKVKVIPSDTMVTVGRNDTLFAFIDNKITRQGSFTWKVELLSSNVPFSSSVTIENGSSFEFRENRVGTYGVSLIYNFHSLKLQSNKVEIDVVNGSTTLLINSDHIYGNLTDPIAFSVTHRPDLGSDLLLGYRWYVDGNPLNQYTSSRISVLFRRAGVYSVYARALLYNGSSINSNIINTTVVPSGYWNGSDMAAGSGYFSGPLLVHTPLNSSSYILWNGPGVYLPHGEYIVNFTMMISNTTGRNYPVMSLLVQGSVNSTTSISKTLNIYRDNFNGPMQYKTFSIIFNQTYDENIGFNFIGESPNHNITIYLRSISVSPVHSGLSNGVNFTIKSNKNVLNLTSEKTFLVSELPSDDAGMILGYGGIHLLENSANLRYQLYYSRFFPPLFG
jgi:hypothetical protein